MEEDREWGEGYLWLSILPATPAFPGAGTCWAINLIVRENAQCSVGEPRCKCSALNRWTEGGTACGLESWHYQDSMETPFLSAYLPDGLSLLSPSSCQWSSQECPGPRHLQNSVSKWHKVSICQRKGTNPLISFVKKENYFWYRNK